MPTLLQWIRQIQFTSFYWSPTNYSFLACTDTLAYCKHLSDLPEITYHLKSLLSHCKNRQKPPIKNIYIQL